MRTIDGLASLAKKYSVTSSRGFLGFYQNRPKCAHGEGHHVFVLLVTYPGGRMRDSSSTGRFELCRG
jgi:hypothetical protein